MKKLVITLIILSSTIIGCSSKETPEELVKHNEEVMNTMSISCRGKMITLDYLISNHYKNVSQVVGYYYIFKGSVPTQEAIDNYKNLSSIVYNIPIFDDVPKGLAMSATMYMALANIGCLTYDYQEANNNLEVIQSIRLSNI